MYIYKTNISYINIPDPRNFSNPKSFFDLFPGVKTIQTFDDTKAKRKNLTKMFHFNGEVTEKILSDLRFINELGAGIYMTINETNGKGRLADDIVRIRSVFVDLDGSPLEPVLKYNPTLVVESSPGKYHAYWFVSDMPLPAFSPMQKNIARIFNGDKVVHDLPRVLRVPGFLHQKKEPFLTCIRGGIGTVFTYRGLVEMFPPAKVKQWSGEKYGNNRPVNSGDFRGQYGAPLHERNIHVLRRVGGCIKRGKTWDYIIQEAFKEGLACSPPLKEQEIQNILKSAKRYYNGTNRNI